MPRRMRPTPPKGASIREELRLHSRYIRDTLVPLLPQQRKLSHSDSVCLHSIFRSLDTIPMTLELLRYSRIEKALMAIATMGSAYWPMEILAHAAVLITKWEDELGPLKNLRADLYGPGGRMEGVRKITWKDGGVPDDVREILIHKGRLDNDTIGDEISLVYRRGNEPISSPRFRSPRLRSRRVRTSPPYLYPHT